MLVEYINIIVNKIDKEFLKLLQSSNNKWLVFEYLRQIFKDLSSQATLKGEDITLISLLLGRLYNINRAEFSIEGIKFLTKFENKKYLGICVGTFLSNLNDKPSIKSLVEVMGINERTFNLDFWTFIAKALEKENKELLEFLGQIIFNKWDNFFKKLFTDEKITLGLICTDYLNIVVWYFQECLSKDKPKFLNY